MYALHDTGPVSARERTDGRFNILEIMKTFSADITLLKTAIQRNSFYAEERTNGRSIAADSIHFSPFPPDSSSFHSVSQAFRSHLKRKKCKRLKESSGLTHMVRYNFIYNFPVKAKRRNFSSFPVLFFFLLPSVSSTVILSLLFWGLFWWYFSWTKQGYGEGGRGGGGNGRKC